MDLRRTLGPVAAWAITVTAIAGCTGYATNVASGGTCQRTAQCAPGLVCAQNACTSDLSMFGMGHATVLDGGVTDTGVVPDAATIYDANLPDTAVPPVDAFTVVDAFTPPVDAFTAVDAFTPPVDAFTPPVDAFTPPVDAFAGDDANIDVGP